MEQKIAFTRKEAAKSISVSLPTMDCLIHRSGFPVVRVGKKVLIPVDAFRLWLEKQAGFDRSEYTGEEAIS